jgi:hypothetical protein
LTNWPGGQNIPVGQFVFRKEATVFDNLFPLLGHAGVVISLVSVLGVAGSAVLAEVLGAAFRNGGRPRHT